MLQKLLHRDDCQKLSTFGPKKLNNYSVTIHSIMPLTWINWSKMTLLIDNLRILEAYQTPDMLIAKVVE